MKTLLTDITSYLSIYPTPEAIHQSAYEEVVFELLLDNVDTQQLEVSAMWVSVAINGENPEYFYLKRFNDSSHPFHFIKTILQQNNEGMISVNLEGPSDSIPKLLERVGMMGEIKHIFFGRSQKNKVLFRGKKVVLQKSAIKNFEGVMTYLRKNHIAAGSPAFY